jgi:molecular chaperone DnaK
MPVSEIVLVDVTPLTLGVETLGGVATPLISRNTVVPVKKSENFTTAADMQTSVTIHVFQGERPMARDNTSLGEFNLDGLAPAPRGVPKIEVTFDIDASGILDATAKDVATGKAQSIRISGSTRLPEADKQRMIKDAEKYAEEDRRRREQADKLNDADAICYQGERFLADFGEKVVAEQPADGAASRRQRRGRGQGAARARRHGRRGENPLHAPPALPRMPGQRREGGNQAAPLRALSGNRPLNPAKAAS